MMVGWQRLQSIFNHVDAAWFALALSAAALAQVVSVFRWAQIARIFGLVVRLPALALAYAQGMTLNAILPGATLGGDALRSFRLQALGNAISVSALTVLLDRLSGLWILCVLSLVSGGLAFFIGVLHRDQSQLSALSDQLNHLLPGLGHNAVWLVLVYLLGLLILCALPWWPLSSPRSPQEISSAAQARTRLARVGQLLRRWHDLAHAQRVPLGRSLGTSILVQALCACAFWSCSCALGGHLPFWQVQAVAAPVFIAGAIPLSYGGFGARELVALLVFPLVGASPDLGVAASALYGVLGIILGVVTAPAFVFSAKLP